MKRLKFPLFIALTVALCAAPVYQAGAASGVASVAVSSVGTASSVTPQPTTSVQAVEPSVVEEMKGPLPSFIPGWPTSMPQTGIIGTSEAKGMSPSTVITVSDDTTSGSISAGNISTATSITPTTPAAKTGTAINGEIPSDLWAENEVAEIKILSAVEEKTEAVETTEEAAPAQALIQITKPETNDTVFKSAYSICGVRNSEVDAKEVITVYLLRYNPETFAYEFFEDVEGVYTWEIGANGVFTKNVELSEGENRFALAAYKSSLGVAFTVGDVQTALFNITYKGQETVDKINEKLKELTVSNIFKEIEKK